MGGVCCNGGTNGTQQVDNSSGTAETAEVLTTGKGGAEEVIQGRPYPPARPPITIDAADEEGAPLSPIVEENTDQVKEQSREYSQLAADNNSPDNNQSTAAVASASSSSPQKKYMEEIWKGLTQGKMTSQEEEFFQDKVTSQPRRPSSVGTGFQDYSEKYDNLFERIKTLDKPDGWILKKTVDGVDIYTKTVEGEEMLFTKGTCKMKTYGNGIRHLAANLLRAEDRPKYDEMCAHGETVESYLPYYRIVYFQIKTPIGIAPRDVLTLSRLRFEPDGALVLATASIDHVDKPEAAPHVRTSAVGGYIIAPTGDPDEFKVTFVMCANPKGWLPGWLKALIAWKAQLVLVNFKKFYEDTNGAGKR